MLLHDQKNKHRLINLILTNCKSQIEIKFKAASAITFLLKQRAITALFVFVVVVVVSSYGLA